MTRLDLENARRCVAKASACAESGDLAAARTYAKLALASCRIAEVATAGAPQASTPAVDRNPAIQSDSPTPDQGEDLLTVAEVAEITRIPEATLRWFRHANKGPRSAKLGRRVAYRRADVEAWIEAQFNAQADEAESEDA